MLLAVLCLLCISCSWASWAEVRETLTNRVELLETLDKDVFESSPLRRIEATSTYAELVVIWASEPSASGLLQIESRLLSACRGFNTQDTLLVNIHDADLSELRSDAYERAFALVDRSTEIYRDLYRSFHDAFEAALESSRVPDSSSVIDALEESVEHLGPVLRFLTPDPAALLSDLRSALALIASVRGKSSGGPSKLVSKLMENIQGDIDRKDSRMSMRNLALNGGNLALNGGNLALNGRASNEGLGSKSLDHVSNSGRGKLERSMSFLERSKGHGSSDSKGHGSSESHEAVSRPNSGARLGRQGSARSKVLGQMWTDSSKFLADSSSVVGSLLGTPRQADPYATQKLKAMPPRRKSASKEGGSTNLTGGNTNLAGSSVNPLGGSANPLRPVAHGKSKEEQKKVADSFFGIGTILTNVLPDPHKFLGPHMFGHSGRPGSGRPKSKYGREYSGRPPVRRNAMQSYLTSQTRIVVSGESSEFQLYSTGDLANPKQAFVIDLVGGWTQEQMQEYDDLLKPFGYEPIRFILGGGQIGPNCGHIAACLAWKLLERTGQLKSSENASGITAKLSGTNAKPSEISAKWSGSTASLTPSNESQARNEDLQARSEDSQSQSLDSPKPRFEGERSFAVNGDEAPVDEYGLSLISEDVLTSLGLDRFQGMSFEDVASHGIQHLGQIHQEERTTSTSVPVVESEIAVSFDSPLSVSYLDLMECNSYDVVRKFNARLPASKQAGEVLGFLPGAFDEATIHHLKSEEISSLLMPEYEDPYHPYFAIPNGRDAIKVKIVEDLLGHDPRFKSDRWKFYISNTSNWRASPKAKESPAEPNEQTQLAEVDEETKAEGETMAEGETRVEGETISKGEIGTGGETRVIRETSHKASASLPKAEAKDGSPKENGSSKKKTRDEDLPGVHWFLIAVKIVAE